MLITPHLKGQITKAIEAARIGHGSSFYGAAFVGVRLVFERYMPKQQAKHAAREALYYRGIIPGTRAAS